MPCTFLKSRSFSGRGCARLRTGLVAGRRSADGQARLVSPSSRRRHCCFHFTIMDTQHDPDEWKTGDEPMTGRPALVSGDALPRQ
jgi:hypothetical protein